MMRCKKYQRAKFWERVKKKLLEVVHSIEGDFALNVYAGRISTTELVNRIFTFTEVYCDKSLFPYQEQFSKRVIRSVLENDGEEITSLFSRQSGKTETISNTCGGLMIILPTLANMPMFLNDTRLQMFKDGISIGIFAPSQRQAQITYGRVKSRIQSKSAMAVLEDPEFNLTFTTSNGQTVALSNGSFVTAISASDGSSIEGESFKLIICEECQDISNFKIRKSIHPMGAAYNATIVKIGTATTFKGDFYEAIKRNKAEMPHKDGLHHNHFEYDYNVAAKYNPKYATYVEKEKKRLGENSDEFQMSYCVTPETRILTSDLRWVRADTIKAGDKLIGFDENPPKRYGQRKFKETLVEDVGVIERPCYEVTLNDRTKVTCSEEHRWLVFTAGSRTVWKQTKDLVPTDRIYKVCDVWEDFPKDYRLGYLSAAFDSEGCITQCSGRIQQLTFAQRDNVMLRQVKEYLTDFGFDFNADYYDKRKEEKGQDLVYKLYIKGGKRELLRFLGSIRPKRLLNNFNPNQLGTVRCSNGELGSDIHPRVESLKYVGERKVIPIRTTTRTYVAEGFASHNCLKWIIERGMFIDIPKFETHNLEYGLDTVDYDMQANHVAGIDIGGANNGDSTVVTIVEVDWSMPVIMESRTNDETGEEEFYTAYNTYLVGWLEIRNMPNHEDQYPIIMDYLSHFRISRVMCDATRESAVAHRLAANLKCEVIPYIFTQKSKSEMYKHLDREISAGRARVAGSDTVRESHEYNSFIQQLGDLQKGWSGSNMVVAHPDEKGAHDDYPDSWALAVLGAASTAETDNTETRNNTFTSRTQVEVRATKQINRITARRRR